MKRALLIALFAVAFGSLAAQAQGGGDTLFTRLNSAKFLS